MTDQLELSLTKIIPAPRKVVFEAWLDPEALAKFMRPGEGMTVPKAESDARVGGNFLIVMKAGDKEMPHHGEYKVIDKYERLVFTWLSDHSIPGSTVTLSFKELGPSETELTLHHVGFANQESCEQHTGGWAAIVARLGTTVS